ncbi:MAG TPA: PPK2 family polyphosphate kinase [Cyclobacteriaceae bacterium]|jgi:PPK2 family polyphosphate:nucleotide phosphotransferase
MRNQKHEFDHSVFIVPPGKKTKLSNFDPDYVGQIKGKKHSKETLREDIDDLASAQELLWASAEKSMLIIFQALDAAGKDGTIKHVMTGINPQGCNVYSFKAPTEEERLHHFLWRPNRFLPPRGRIAIFNRSYYEEVLIVRVHPEILKSAWLPREMRKMSPEKIWKTRFNEIRDTEKRWTQNGIQIVKFFLNVGKSEQKKRFMERLNNSDKNWKFSVNDFKERQYWDGYMKAYEEMLNETSTSYSPWYVVPANNKWYTRAVVADVITKRISEMDLAFPAVSESTMAELREVKKKLMEE